MARAGIDNCSGCEPSRRNEHHHLRSLDNALSRSARTLPSTCRLSLDVIGGVRWFVLPSGFGHVVEVVGVGCEAAWLLRVGANVRD